jgi:hypothetical protein
MRTRSGHISSPWTGNQHDDPMRREKVESTSIESVGYDRELSVLEVEFAHGGVYRYRQVPPSVHRGFLDAESPGQYFNTVVRGRFPEQKLG